MEAERQNPTSQPRGSGKTPVETRGTPRMLGVVERTAPDRSLLRLSATLLFVGLLLSTVAQLPHPEGAATTEATFANYAAGGVGAWVAIHLAQLVGEAVLLAGLIVLFFALNLSVGAPRWVGLSGAISAGVALGLYTVLSAVDGVALKHAVDAWASAPAAEKAARLTSAEAVRWLEWGTNSYWSFTRGLALVLFAIVIVWTARVQRPIGVLAGLSGLAFIVLGWQVGTEGFTSARALPTDVAYLSLLVLAVWLLVVAWRREASSTAVHPARHDDAGTHRSSPIT